MNAITWIHIAGGAVALASGAIAISVQKGSSRHVAWGTAFCVAMFVLGVTASVLAPFKTPAETPIGGIIVCYFVATAWLAARNRRGVPGPYEKIACAVILAIAALMIGEGLRQVLTGTPQLQPPGPVGLMVFGSFCALAGLGDLRFILRRPLTTSQRIARHLWRMCFALFIATGSFFLGQQDVLPQAVRGSAWLLVLAFAPFALMVFWLVRNRIARTPALRPLPIGD